MVDTVERKVVGFVPVYDDSFETDLGDSEPLMCSSCRKVMNQDFEGRRDAQCLTCVAGVAHNELHRGRV